MALLGQNPRKPRFSGKKAEKPPKWGFPGQDPKNPDFGVTGAPARGVDVKPPHDGSGKGSKMPKKGYFREKGQKRHFLAKIPIFRDFRGFWPPGALPDRVPGGGFTSTPRAGAPRFPGLGPGSQDATQRRRGGAPTGGGGESPSFRRRGVGPGRKATSIRLRV